jgi:hypothetical protein
LKNGEYAVWFENQIESRRDEIEEVLTEDLHGEETL